VCGGWPGHASIQGGDELIGIDLVDVRRLEELLARSPAFARTYFSAAERRECESGRDPARRLAACLAAKEAFLKALGEGVLGPIALAEIEVLRGDGSQPHLRLGASATGAVRATGRRRALLSVAEDDRRAIALVLLD
jgi:holo-[acyl-carrier protein] synthase